MYFETSDQNNFFFFLSIMNVLKIVYPCKIHTACDEMDSAHLLGLWPVKKKPGINMGLNNQ